MIYLFLVEKAVSFHLLSTPKQKGRQKVLTKRSIPLEMAVNLGLSLSYIVLTLLGCSVSITLREEKLLYKCAD